MGSSVLLPTSYYELILSESMEEFDDGDHWSFVQF